MYSFIRHPLTKKKYHILSNTGKYILKLYISNLLAGYNIESFKKKIKSKLLEAIKVSIDQEQPGVYVTPTKNWDHTKAISWDSISQSLEIKRNYSDFKLSDFIKEHENIFQIITGEKESDKYITFSNHMSYYNSLKLDPKKINQEDIEKLIQQDVDKEALCLCNVNHLHECGLTNTQAGYLLNLIADSCVKK